MKKKFKMENEVGILMEYTVLAVTEESDTTYVIYTNYFPSANELGVRLFAGKLVDTISYRVSKISKEKEKKLIEAFTLEMIKTGKKIKRVK